MDSHMTTLCLPRTLSRSLFTSPSRSLISPFPLPRNNSTSRPSDWRKLSYTYIVVRHCVF